jgi:PKD domain
LQPKLLDNHHLLLLSVGALMIVSLIVFSQVVTSTITTTATATATSEMKDIELEDKAIKHELEPMETKEIEEEDNMAKQQEEEEEQPLPLGITIIQEPPLPQSPLPNNVTSTIPPTALAGVDQVVKEGDKVTLDGTGSFDPDGTIVSYEWILEEWDDEDPPPANLSAANTSTATFTAPVLNSTSGAYGLDLTITDNDGLTHTDSTVVTVKKAASEESIYNNSRTD